MYVYWVYPAIWKSPKQPPICLEIDEAIILFLNLSVVLHESGTRNVLLAPSLNKTEVYLTPFISTQNHTIAE
jgi:hypothetical protein